MADLSQHTRELRRDTGLDAGLDASGVRAAVRTGLAVAVAALVCYVLASMWVGTCTGSIANAAGCGAPQRAMLMMGAPGILLAGGFWTLARGVRSGRDQAAWHGTAAVLLGLMVFSVVGSLPSLPV
jgi:hypothetical protein